MRRQVGVEAVGKGKVNDAVHAAKGHGGFGLIAREGIKPRPLASGEDHGERICSLSGMSRPFTG